MTTALNSTSSSLVLDDDDEEDEERYANSHLSWADDDRGQGRRRRGQEESQDETFPNNNSCSQPTQEIMTQNPEWSQLGEDPEHDGVFSPLAPGRLSPLHVDEREQPWGRLLPSGNSDLSSNTTMGAASSSSAQQGNARYSCYFSYTSLSPIDLLPRSPERKGTKDKGSNLQQAHSSHRGGISLLGLSNVHVSDIFNVHVMGRAKKVDVTASEPKNNHNDNAAIVDSTTTTSSRDHSNAKKIKAMHDWAYGLISNRHCRIYCRLDDTTTVLMGDKEANHYLGSTISCAGERSSLAVIPPPQVYVEDCSGNGTLINRSIILRKGERRLLHSGDEICLTNPEVLRSKIRSQTVMQQIMQQHSFVFVNLLPHRITTTTRTTTTTAHPLSALLPSSSPQPSQGLFSAALLGPGFPNNRVEHQPLHKAEPPNARTKPAVNVREVKHPSQQKRQAFSNYPHSFASLAAKQAAKQGSTRAFSSYNHGRDQARRFEEDYDLRDMLGSGTVGQVFRAIHRKTGQKRAVKRIAWTGGLPNRQIFNREHNDNNQLQQHPWQAEAAILQQLNHPYIVNLIDVYVNSNALFIVMELLQGGDLFDRIVARERYAEIASRRVLRRLLSAVHYLHHECNIVHRDLKPENILLVSQTNDIHIKITDFGLAKNCDQGLKTFCGTPQYFAPEVLQRQLTVTGQGRYGKPADMWSVGVILYVLLSGTTPFQHPPPPPINGCNQSNNNGMLHYQQHISQVDFPEDFWHNVSESARDLVRCLLVPDPRRRYTVAQACQHAWILEDDGDTHIHPLEDPQLVGITKPQALPTVEKREVDTKGNDDVDVTANEKLHVEEVEEVSSMPNALDNPPTNELQADNQGSTTTVEALKEETKRRQEASEPSDETGPEIASVESAQREKMAGSANQDKQAASKTAERDVISQGSTDHVSESKQPQEQKELKTVNDSLTGDASTLPDTENSKMEDASSDAVHELKQEDEPVKRATGCVLFSVKKAKKQNYKSIRVSSQNMEHDAADNASEKEAAKSAHHEGLSTLTVHRHLEKSSPQVGKVSREHQKDESITSRRVSDASSEPASLGADRLPLSPMNVNNRPQAFRNRMVEQALSETKGKNKESYLQTEDGCDDIRSQFSEWTESFSSSPDSLVAAPTTLVEGKENHKPQRKSLGFGETRSKRKRAKGPVTASSSTKKRKRNTNEASTAMPPSTSKKPCDKKQTTLADWFVPDKC
ncbi:hypothetical protein ACA910_007275 [Epithemia clementina (nom. ined.)]